MESILYDLHLNWTRLNRGEKLILCNALKTKQNKKKPNQIVCSRKCLLSFLFILWPLGGILTPRLGTNGLKHNDIFMQCTKKIWLNRKSSDTRGTYISALWLRLRLSLQPSQGETDWGDYWLLSFRLTQAQCGRKLPILPAIVCPATTLLHHKGHWGAQLSERSPTTAGVTALSLFILSVSPSSPLCPQVSF